MSGKSPEIGRSRAVALALLAWLVPSAGHFALGRKGRATIFAILIFLSIAVGRVIDGHLVVFVPGQPLSYLLTLGAMGMGAPYFLLRWIFEYQGIPEAAGFEYGRVFLLSAGLMNLLLVLDVWDIATGRKE